MQKVTLKEAFKDVKAKDLAIVLAIFILTPMLLGFIISSFVALFRLGWVW